MASGVPVIAYRAGGALETIKENETGIFFDEQTPEALSEALAKFETMQFDLKKVREHALQWGKPIFQNRLGEYCEHLLGS